MVPSARLAAFAVAAMARPAVTEVLAVPPPPALPTLPPLPSMAPLRGMLTPMDVPEPRLYDCDAEYEQRHKAWTAEWKEWCCEHHNKGCPSTSTRTATSSTSTATTSVTSTHTTTKSTTMSTTTTTLSKKDGERACAKVCIFNGLHARCSDRILWGKTQEMKDERAPCAASHEMVLDYCPVCGKCPLEYSGCDTDPDLREEIIMKDIELPKVLPAPTKIPQFILGVVVSAIGAVGLVTLASRELRWRYSFSRQRRHAIPADAVSGMVTGRAEEWATPMEGDISGSEDGNI